MAIRFQEPDAMQQIGGIRFQDVPLDNAEAGFFGKIAESFDRGQEQVLSGLAIYEAMSNPNVDMVGALNVRKKLRARSAMDPIESNWLSDLVYASSRTAGQVFESAKAGGKGVVIGGLAGAAVGGGVGLLVPSIGEEPVTIGVGARAGMRLGGAEGVALFAYKSGVGEMYADMLDQQVSPEIADKVAHIAGLPYAIIEMMQVRALTPALKNSVFKSLSKVTATKLAAIAAKKYVGVLTVETLEEVAQEIVQIGAEDIAKHLDGHGVKIDKDRIVAYARRILATGKEALKSFSLLPLPGTLLEAGIASTSLEVQNEIAEARGQYKTKPALRNAAIRLKSGEILEGPTHSEILRGVAESGRKIANEEFDMPAGSGFITDDGQFVKVLDEVDGNIVKVDEAWDIAEQAGQIKSPDPDVLGEEKTTVIPKDKIKSLKTIPDVIDSVATERNLPPLKAGHIRLYRGQHPTKQKDLFHPKRGVLTDKEIKQQGLSQGQGGWFTPLINYALKYSEAQGVGGEIVYVDVPIEEANKYRREEAPAGLAKEGEALEYFIPSLRTEAAEQAAAWQTFIDNRHLVAENVDFTVGHDQKIEVGKLTPSDLNTPLGKVGVAIRNSIDTFVSQETIRKREKGKRFGEAQEVRETYEGSDWRVKAKQHLKGAYSKLGIEPLQNQVPFEVYESLNQDLRATTKLSTIEAIKLGDALEAMFKQGEIFAPYVQGLAERQWGRNFADLLDELHETVTQKPQTGFQKAVDLMNLPRATSASGDLSRTGRQNILMIGKPKLWFKALQRDWRLLLANPETAKQLENERHIALDKRGDLINKSGIRINQWGAGIDFKRGAERFASRVAKRIPGVMRSERAYSAGGNILRMDYLAQIADQRKGKVTTDKQWRDMGHVINLLTGEGDARRFGKAGPVMNAIFFAPRLAEARVRAFTDLFNPKLDGVARKMLAYHMATFVGLNMGLLTLAANIPGVHVETDWNSSDFGKIRYKDTRIDFWGGYLPLARLLIRIKTGKVKTQAGSTIDVETMDTVTTFLQSKLGPVPSYALDLLKGETFYGDYVGVDAESSIEQFYQRFTPFFLQDIADAIRFQGLGTGLATAPLAFHGVGVQTYPMSKSAQVLDYKNRVASQVMGEKWDNLGPEVQEYLRAGFPEIDQLDKQAAYDRTNFDFLERMARERLKTQERIASKMPADVVLEFKELAVHFSAPSKKIGADWRLSDVRYADYEAGVTTLYKEILPELIRSSMWPTIPEPIKIDILNKIMTSVKTRVRDMLMMEANANDLQGIRP